MAWWEGKLKSELRKLPPAEIERVVGEAVETVNNDQLMAFARALKREVMRRGLLKERHAT